MVEKFFRIHFALFWVERLANDDHVSFVLFMFLACQVSHRSLGSEITLKALQRPTVNRCCRCYLLSLKPCAVGIVHTDTQTTKPVVINHKCNKSMAIGLNGRLLIILQMSVYDTTSHAIQSPIQNSTYCLFHTRSFSVYTLIMWATTETTTNSRVRQHRNLWSCSQIIIFI